MIFEVFRRHNLTIDKNTDWIPMVIDNLNSKGKLLEAKSVSIIWKNAQFDSAEKPSVMIECSEDGNNSSFLKFIQIDSVDNSNDVTTLVVTQIFKFLRFGFIHGSSSNGSLFININYR